MFQNPSLLGLSGLYVTGEDNIRLTTFGALAGMIVALEARLIDAEGRVVPIVETHTPNSDRTAKTSIVPLRESLLSNVQLRASTGAAVRGHCYAIVEIIRGREGAVTPIGTLFSGYVVANGRLAWPGGVAEPSVSGIGRARVISGTVPAAGAEIAETVPAGVLWLLTAFSVGLQNSATVANRVPVLTIDDGATVAWQAASNVNLTAGQLGIYRMGAGSPLAQIGATHYLLPLPAPLYLLPGARLRTITTGIQVGDQYAAPTYAVQEWLQP